MTSKLPFNLEDLLRQRTVEENWTETAHDGAHDEAHHRMSGEALR